MKLLFFSVALSVAALSGCNTEREAPAPAPIVAKLPFESSTLKVERIATSLPVWVQAIHFTDAATGVASTYDGKIYKTGDGGKSWALQYARATSAANLPLVQLLFTSASVGYAVGGSLACNGSGCTPPGGLILKTTDGGSTWAVVYQASNAVIAALAVNSTGELLAIANDAGARILKSTDAGATWVPVSSWPYQLTKIASDRNRGYCTSAKGTIIRSTDSGASWAEAARFTYPYLNALAFSTGVGFCATGYGPVYRTTDDGMSWTLTAPSSFSAEVIDALTPTSCLIFGAGRYSGGDFGTFSGSLRQTTDGGSSWTEIELSEVGAVRYSSFYTPQNGYAVAGSTLLKVTVK